MVCTIFRSLQADYGDVHPVLSDRLSALGQQARLPAQINENAAAHYLAESLTTLTDTLNTKWRTSVFYRWRMRYKESQESQQTLAELEKEAQTRQLTIEEAWQRAYLTEEFRGSQDVMPLYQSVLELDYRHPGALFSVGRILLSRNDEKGIKPIQKAIERDRRYGIPGCELVCTFLIESGRNQEAERFFVDVMKPQ